MESLKIKCPACGIILEVTNSKNEAVKRIVCPNCKKTLAITFHDEKEPEQKMDLASLPVLYYGQMRIALQEGQNQIPLPDSEDVTIRVVRLNDGNCKCLVSTKQDKVVRLNDEYLLMDDEVALSDGDVLHFGKTQLSFNKPFDTDNVIKDTSSTAESAPQQTPSEKHNWWITVAACIAAVVLMVSLWPKEEKVVIKDTTEKKETKDSAIQKSRHSGTITERKKKDDDTNKRRLTIEDIEIGEFELEQMALKGNVEAQYRLGERWVNSKDSTNIVKGCNYLKLAIRNGHKDANRKFQNVKSTLREAANKGNTHAENLLKVINGE